jgi:putative hydrolase of the HAD superfamily
MTWLLCDYGQVLGLPQPDEAVEAMARSVGLDRETFEQRFWEHRRAYDRADLPDDEYWRLIAGRPMPEAQVRELVRLDTASWLHPNMGAIRAAESAGTRGYRLAILSNAPVDLARVLDDAPWLNAFGPRIFSCRLHLSKPDPAIYRYVLRELNADPEEIVFFDDRPDNVLAAQAIGMQAQVFHSPEQIKALPYPADSRV